jgi:TRAP-type C4-dicarboxylate transport system permease small subunit
MFRPTKYLTVAGKDFNILACVVVIAMMLLSAADVILRLFGKPIPGTYEWVGFPGTFVVSFVQAFTSMGKGHIAVEIFGIAMDCALVCLFLTADFIKSLQRTLDR